MLWLKTGDLCDLYAGEIEPPIRVPAGEDHFRMENGKINWWLHPSDGMPTSKEGCVHHILSRGYDLGHGSWRRHIRTAYLQMRKLPKEKFRRRDRKAKATRQLEWLNS